jgi:hypothetical protein
VADCQRSGCGRPATCFCDTAEAGRRLFCVECALAWRREVYEQTGACVTLTHWLPSPVVPQGATMPIPTDPPWPPPYAPDPETPEEHAAKLWDQLNNVRAVALHIAERHCIQLPPVEHETSGDYVIRVLTTLDAMI